MGRTYGRSNSPRDTRTIILTQKFPVACYGESLSYCKEIMKVEIKIQPYLFHMMLRT